MALAQILGPDGLIIVAVLALVLLFGGSKLPKLARSLGGASHEFKSASEEYRQASELGQPVDPKNRPPTHGEAVPSPVEATTAGEVTRRV